MFISAASNRMNQFTSKERDAETGLDYFLARYYSGAQGRFMSPDPLMASGSTRDPQSWNRFTYGPNNPLRFIDPSGLAFYDANGSYIGEAEDGQNYIVTDQAQIKRIKKSTAPLSADVINSAILLPNRAVITEMVNAVDRSNKPTSGGAKDAKFHEDGGQYGLDSSGAQIPVAAAPGPYADPTQGDAHIATGIPANPADAGRIVTLQGTYHAHLAGEISIYPQNSGVGVSLGGIAGYKRGFGQEPSQGPGNDIDNASPGTINFAGRGSRKGVGPNQMMGSSEDRSFEAAENWS
jgi:RHS repeat-associated protein